MSCALFNDKDNGGFVLKEFHGFWNEIDANQNPTALAT